MGLFDIAVSANNFFQFGTNYLALFWFIIFASNLSICDKVLCECERIAVDNTKLTNETTKLPNDVCALSAEKMNSQAKLKIFVMAKPTPPRTTAWLAWTQVLQQCRSCFTFVETALLLFHANAEEERNVEDADVNDADRHDHRHDRGVDSQSDGYQRAEDQDVRNR